LPSSKKLLVSTILLSEAGGVLDIGLDRRVSDGSLLSSMRRTRILIITPPIESDLTAAYSEYVPASRRQNGR
jgi:hypothetical protein